MTQQVENQQRAAATVPCRVCGEGWQLGSGDNFCGFCGAPAVKLEAWLLASSPEGILTVLLENAGSRPLVLGEVSVRSVADPMSGTSGVVTSPNADAKKNSIQLAISVLRIELSPGEDRVVEFKTQGSGSATVDRSLELVATLGPDSKPKPIPVLVPDPKGISTVQMMAADRDLVGEIVLPLEPWLQLEGREHRGRRLCMVVLTESGWQYELEVLHRGLPRDPREMRFEIEYPEKGKWAVDWSPTRQQDSPWRANKTQSVTITLQGDPNLPAGGAAGILRIAAKGKSGSPLDRLDLRVLVHLLVRPTLNLRDPGRGEKSHRVRWPITTGAPINLVREFQFVGLGRFSNIRLEASPAVERVLRGVDTARVELKSEMPPLGFTGGDTSQVGLAFDASRVPQPVHADGPEVAPITQVTISFDYRSEDVELRGCACLVDFELDIRAPTKGLPGVVAIDYGAHGTCVFANDPGGEANPLPRPRRHTGVLPDPAREPSFPSCQFFPEKDGGDLLIGGIAFTKWAFGHENAYSSLKFRLGLSGADRIRYIYNEQPTLLSVEQAVVQYHRRLLEIVSSEMNEPPTQLVLTHPTRMSLLQRRAFRSIRQQIMSTLAGVWRANACLEEIDEASAVAIWCLENADRLGFMREPTASQLVVLDVGASTSDIAVVRITPKRQAGLFGGGGGTRHEFELVARGGMPDFGGNNYTRALVRLALQEAGIVVPAIDPTTGLLFDGTPSPFLGQVRAIAERNGKRLFYIGDIVKRRLSERASRANPGSADGLWAYEHDYIYELSDDSGRTRSYRADLLKIKEPDSLLKNANTELEPRVRQLKDLVESTLKSADGLGAVEISSQFLLVTGRGSLAPPFRTLRFSLDGHKRLDVGQVNELKECVAKGAWSYGYRKSKIGVPASLAVMQSSVEVLPYEIRAHEEELFKSGCRLCLEEQLESARAFVRNPSRVQPDLSGVAVCICSTREGQTLPGQVEVCELRGGRSDSIGYLRLAEKNEGKPGWFFVAVLGGGERDGKIWSGSNSFEGDSYEEFTL